MQQLTPSTLKSILHSRRANIYYLEHCRVLVKDGRVEYVTDEGKLSEYWNIPIANTTTLMLGTGTSITQAAMRELAKAGVLVGFCGGGGTPLFSANEVEIDVAWFSPQSEYRPTEYLQSWVRFWFHDDLRLQAAKMLQRARLNLVSKHWLGSRNHEGSDFVIFSSELEPLVERSLSAIESAGNVQDLLADEGRLTKQLFRLAAQTVGYGDFCRAKKGEGADPANRFLDHGNYLAYGLAATATWVLGLPHGLSVLHGKTRRGGLVFDVADLVKDAIILPQAFISAMRGEDEQFFRQTCIQNLLRHQAMDYMIDNLKSIAGTLAEEAP